MTLIIATDTEASLAGNQGLFDRFLLWRSLRGASLVVALLAAFVFGLGGGSVARAESPGALTALSPPSVAADTGTARVVVSPDGKNVYATNRGTITVSQYSRNSATGKLTPLLQATVEAGASPEGIVVSPDGGYVYVANSGSNNVSQYSRDTATGQLTPLSPATVPAGGGPIGIAISPDGKSVYAADSTANELSQYSRDTTTGVLTPLSPATIAAGANVHGIIVSPDGNGNNVYAANWGEGTVSQYSRDPITGKLAALSPATVAAGVNPHDLAISPEGNSVYVANSASEGKVTRLTRNTTTGELTSPATIAAGEYTECVVVSPDGKNVYATNFATSFGAGTVSQYSRNTATGELTALSPAPTIPAGTAPEGIAVSPKEEGPKEGNSVYVTNFVSGTVLQYARTLPIVVTGSASSIAQTSATLNATVNPNGGTVSDCHFEYGTTFYTTSAPCTPSLGSGTSAVAVSAVAGLSADTTYHFRIVATNAGGTSEGRDQTLKTLPNPPTVETQAASSVTQTAATLNAMVNPNGGTLSDCHFEYGTSTSYGSSATCTAPVAVSASAPGLAPNTTYHFKIVATNEGGTSEGRDQTLKTLPNPPTGVTGSASSITQTSATLNATVNPNGGTVSDCHFVYGPTEPYASSVPCVSLPGSGESPVAVSASVTGLAPNTTYHFRIVATNSGGASPGSDQTLRASPYPPTVETKGASSVTQTSATLNAMVNPNGGTVEDCHFDYGPTESYGFSVPCVSLPGLGLSPVEVSAPVAGLGANTTYHFRIVATNSGGTSEGLDQTFTTMPTPITSAPGGGTSGAGGSAAAGSVLASQTVNVSAAEIRALLGGQLTPSGKKAKIAALLKSGVFTVAFKALEAGTVVIAWYQVPPGAKLAKKAKPKPVLVASGKLTFSAAGTAKVKIKLTAAGKSLLRHAKQSKLTSKGTFTPTGKAPVTALRAFTLER